MVHLAHRLLLGPCRSRRLCERSTTKVWVHCFPTLFSVLGLSLHLSDLVDPTRLIQLDFLSRTLRSELLVHSGQSLVIFLQSFNLPQKHAFSCFINLQNSLHFFEFTLDFFIFTDNLQIEGLLHLHISAHISHFTIPVIQLVALHWVGLVLICDRFLKFFEINLVALEVLF